MHPLLELRHHHGHGIEGLEECDRLVVLLGAPNTGKSSLFNVLTGKTVAVANWPGVTVDMHVGRLRGDSDTCVVDLPGTYGLVPTSPEEAVTREALFRLKPERIVVLLDSTQPEASLNLVIQAVEAFPGRVVVAATKASLSHAQGVHIDYEKLQSMIGAPVVPVSALEGVGVSELIEALTSGPRDGGGIRIDYGMLEPLVSSLENDDDTRRAASELGVSPRWLAVQLVAGDEGLIRILYEAGYHEVSEKALRAYEEARGRLGISPQVYVAERRISEAERIARACVVRRQPAGSRWQRLVDLFLHPILGPIVSLGGLFATFAVIFAVNLGFPLNIILRWAGLEGAAAFIEEYNISTMLETVFTSLAATVKASLQSPLGDLVADGIIGGVGFVLSFVPLIAMVYVSLAILEDSGLAARMAVSFHPILYRFGLSGRSIFPLLMGIGCNVPAVYSTKALPEEERLRAVFAAPFIPCQARLVVMIAFTSVLVEGLLAQSLTMILIYVEGFLAALLTSMLVARLLQPRLYRKIDLQVEAKPELIMELPPVHRPHWRVIWWQVRDNTIHFLRKAGTVIFVLAIVTWAMLSYGPSGYTDNPTNSWGGIIGERIGDVTRIIGVGEDKDEILGVALLDGLIAKEGVLTAIAISQGYSDDGAEQAIARLGLSQAQAIAFLVLISLYFPCIATLASMKSTVRSWRLVALYAVYTILLAIAFAGLTYLVVKWVV